MHVPCGDLCCVVGGQHDASSIIIEWTPALPPKQPTLCKHFDRWAPLNPFSLPWCTPHMYGILQAFQDWSGFARHARPDYNRRTCCKIPPPQLLNRRSPPKSIASPPTKTAGKPIFLLSFPGNSFWALNAYIRWFRGGCIRDRHVWEIILRDGIDSPCVYNYFFKNFFPVVSLWKEFDISWRW